MEGRLIGVGVGSGDPELLTLAAVRAIRESDCILLPNEKKEECYAYKIVRQVVPEIEEKEICPMQFPMTKDADVQTWMAEDVDTDDMEIRLIDLMQYDLQAGSADRTPAVFEFLEWAQARGIWTDENDDEAQSLLTYHSNLCTSRRGIRTFNVSTYRGKTALENYLEN